MVKWMIAKKEICNCWRISETGNRKRILVTEDVIICSISNKHKSSDFNTNAQKLFHMCDF